MSTDYIPNTDLLTTAYNGPTAIGDTNTAIGNINTDIGYISSSPNYNPNYTPNYTPDYNPYYYPNPSYKHPPYYPQQIVVYYPQPVYNSTHDYMLAQQVQSIDDRLDSLEEKVEKLLDLLLNEQDEEVRGHSEGERTSADSEGGTGTSLEVSVRVGGRQPKGDFHWPPRD